MTDLDEEFRMTSAPKAPKKAAAGKKAVEDYATVQAQEDLVVQVQVSVLRAMRERGIKQAELAQRLDVSPARVSQMFGDEARNLTVRTIAKIYHVLGATCQFAEAGPSAEAVTNADTQAPPNRLGARGKFRKPTAPSSLAAAGRFHLRIGATSSSNEMTF
jgi:transcriptional regulator with XRE-family HTH domain